MVDIEFVDAVSQYIEGDPRPLAQFGLANGFTPEQCEFVAKALLGEIAILDGHKHKPQTEYMVRLYDSNKRLLGYPDTVIYRALDKKFGLADGSSRANIKRAKKRAT